MNDIDKLEHCIANLEDEISQLRDRNNEVTELLQMFMKHLPIPWVEVYSSANRQNDTPWYLVPPAGEYRTHQVCKVGEHLYLDEELQSVYVIA